MTYEEAIVVISYIDCPDEKVREALDIAKEAIEKQIPKKPLLVPEGESKIHTFKCPTCGLYRIRKFCDDCGQAIDWSDEK